MCFVTVYNTQDILNTFKGVTELDAAFVLRWFLFLQDLEDRVVCWVQALAAAGEELLDGRLKLAHAVLIFVQHDIHHKSFHLIQNKQDRLEIACFTNWVEAELLAKEHLVFLLRDLVTIVVVLDIVDCLANYQVQLLRFGFHFSPRSERRLRL